MRKLMDRLRGKVAANMAQRGMEPDMADRASQQVFRGAPNVIRRAVDKFDRARGMDGGMRMQPPTPVNRPVPDELVYKKGGSVKESKAMMKKEVAFMKKKGAPKSMVKHEMAEAGMKYGGMAKKKPAKKMAAGGLSAGHKAADGIAKKGKTRGMEVKMAKGGMSRKGC